MLNENIKLLYFEVLDYPIVARLNHVEGVVVVQVKLDDQGKVVSSAALSGPKALIGDSVSNSKKWWFQPNGQKTAVILYDFRIQGLCRSPCPSQFSFRPPNLATITIGEPVIDHAATTIQ